MEKRENINVRVRFYAELKDLLKVKAVNLELTSGSDWGSLVEALSKRLSNDVMHHLRRKGLLIAVNNILVRELNKLELKDGDVIDIMPLPSGG